MEKYVSLQAKRFVELVKKYLQQKRLKETQGKSSIYILYI